MLTPKTRNRATAYAQALRCHAATLPEAQAERLRRVARMVSRAHNLRTWFRASRAMAGACLSVAPASMTSAAYAQLDAWSRSVIARDAVA